MLTMWVTEDEHRRLLERCDGKQLAAWMRQTCLDEKPTRAGRLPSISPALLRQLAGMGNNLNQIARYLNEYGAPYNALSSEVRAAVSDLAALKFEVLKVIGEAYGNDQAYQL